MSASTNITLKPGQSIAALIPPGARAVLVSLDRKGGATVMTVPHGCSVLNIENELRMHLDECPHSDEWLLQLRDYCDARLAARKQAHATGQIMIAVDAGALWPAHEYRFLKFSVVDDTQMTEKGGAV